MALPEKYKGKSFAEISKDIQKKYENRFDPITNRGRRKEMTSLKEAQEQVREQEQMKQMFQQKLTETIANIGQQQVMEEQIPITENNNPALPNIEQPVSNKVSQSYNQNFETGGDLDNDEDKPKPFSYKIQNEDGSYTVVDIPSESFVSNVKPTRTTVSPPINNVEQDSTISQPIDIQKVLSSLPPMRKVKSNPKFDSKTRKTGDRKFFDVGGPFNPLFQKPNLNFDTNVGQNTVGLGFNNSTIGTDDFTNAIKNQVGINNTSIGSSYNTADLVNPSGNYNLSNLAPLAMNIGQLLSARKPKDVRSQLNDYQVDTPNFQVPTQQYYEKVDMSPIERGIQEQAATFSATNRNISGGNSGQFLANEQANKANVMDAIGRARMGQQQSNLQVDQMNASERARVEQMLMQQELARQGTEQTNIGLGFQIEDINARNLGAYQSNKSNIMSQIAENLSARQKEQLMAKAVEEALGYGYTGQYGKNPGTTSDFLKNILKTRKRK
jgi:hypothetical protein